MGDLSQVDLMVPWQGVVCVGLAIAMMLLMTIWLIREQLWGSPIRDLIADYDEALRTDDSEMMDRVLQRALCNEVWQAALTDHIETLAESEEAA